MMQNINAFQGISNMVDVSATVANSAKSIVSDFGIAAPTVDAVGMNLRVCNEGTTGAFVAMGSSAVDATTDPKRFVVVGGAERVFALRPGITHVAVAMRSGTANITLQIGTGV